MDVTVNPITITVTHSILPVDLGDVRLLTHLNDIVCPNALLSLTEGDVYMLGQWKVNSTRSNG